MKINKPKLSFGNNYNTQSTKNLNKIVLHHSAGTGSVYDVHNYHRSIGWAGIGYHYYVRKDGTIWKGRPDTMVGAHTEGYNTNSLGVCAEGNYETTKTMPAKQKESLTWLVAYLKDKYDISTVKPHRYYDSTACPGKYYPFGDITSGKVQTYCTITLPVLDPDISFSGTSAKNVQRLLNLLGYKDGSGNKLKITSRYDKATVQAVKKFQKKRGLKQDGVFGADSWAALLKNSKKK